MASLEFEFPPKQVTFFWSSIKALGHTTRIDEAFF